MSREAPARRVLITGGIRSGKSHEAERRLAGEPTVTYVATARCDGDLEWAARIAVHRARRPAHWRTVETIDVASLLRDTPAEHPPLLIECVNTWLAETMDAAGCWADPVDPASADLLAVEVNRLVREWSLTPARVVAVTNEVGLSLVPTTRAGRWFAEELGTLNARLAAEADEVWLVVAGIPTRLK